MTVTHGETIFTSFFRYSCDESSYCVVLVTPFMLRVHRNMKEASEVLFVDATTNCDRQNSAVVPLLCSSAGGALPLGLLFLSNQTEEMFFKGELNLFRINI